MKAARTFAGSLAGLGLALAASAVAAMPRTPAAANSQAAEFFETRVRPVLAGHCLTCHGARRQRGGLRLDSRASLLQGGDDGPVVVAGDPDHSLLIQAVRREGDIKMPPKKMLPAPAVEALTAWVKMGAPWPDSPRPAAAAAQTKHWAFRPVRRPAIPAVKDPAWVQSPIDAFILARLERQGLTPARPADRRGLIRRATFDLIGLPPTPEEIDAFVADPAPDAFAKVVDRLLASPHYGERWGRYWLDVARYADTKGYVFEQERRFPYSYTYRDYVIRAFNEDLPYDQFLLQQIAADSLPLGQDRRPLAAMGFLTLGRRFMNNTQDIIDDRIDVVARGTLGLTVTCARCHDHKFDPIPTKDYYSLYGVFAGSAEKYVPLVSATDLDRRYGAFEKQLRARKRAVDEFIDARRREVVARFRAQVAEYLLAAHDAEGLPPTKQFMFVERAGDLRPAVVERWKQLLDRSRRRFDPVFAPWHAFAALPEKEFAARAPALAQAVAANADPARRLNPLVARAFAGKPPASLREVARRYATLLAGAGRLWRQALDTAAKAQAPPPRALPDAAQEQLRQVLYAEDAPPNVPAQEIRRLFDKPTLDRLRALRKRVEEWLGSPGAPPQALVLDDAPTQHDQPVFIRGNSHRPGPVVPRRFLRVLAGDHRKPFQHGSGRLDLARAIIARDNPLTARVMVNRIWLHHFGAGLVTTPSDFGARSDPPSHPELLDYLAWRFMEGGWSIKKVHRLIMLSSVYQQSSIAGPRSLRADPENRLLGRMNRRRLDFEALRDALLAVAGNLDATIGGRPVDLAAAPLSNRRTIYGFIDRQNLMGLYRTFDFPSPDTTSPQRHTTTVPQQALFLMNSPFVVDQARRLVRRADFTALARADQQIQHLYRLVYGRAATPDEVALGLRFIQAAPAPHPEPAARPLRAWEEYAQVLVLANEFSFID